MEKRLATLSKHIEEINQRGRLPKEREVEPKTTLEIQGDADSESAWQRYLRYFLDPGERHGLGSAFASALVGLLQRNGIVNSGLNPGWENVVVRREAPGDSSRPDLLMYEPDEWFACFELKIYHEERPGQTVDHVQSQKLGKLDKGMVPEDHHYYFYVAPPWAGDGEAPEFEAVPWDGDAERPTVVEAIAEVQETVGGNIPPRTVAQLEEFRDTIGDTINMTDIDEQTRELTGLYLKHRTDIDQILEAKDNYADWFFETRVPAALNGDYSPSYWEDDWEFDSYSGHTKIYRDTWRPGGDIDVHLEYYPRAEKLFGGEIHIRFDIEFKGDNWKKADGRRPQQVFVDELLSVLDGGHLPDAAKITKEETSGIHKFLNIRYNFAMDCVEDYLEALEDALEDMAPLIPAIDDVIARWDNIVEEACGQIT